VKPLYERSHVDIGIALPSDMSPTVISVFERKPDYIINPGYRRVFPSKGKAKPCRELGDICIRQGSKGHGPYVIPINKPY
jgi:hypothetical protein